MTTPIELICPEYEAVADTCFEGTPPREILRKHKLSLENYMVLIAQPEFQARMELLAECQAMMLRESLLRTCRLLELRSPEKTETWQLISRWLVNLAPPLRERIWIGANALMEEMGECSWLASGKKGKKGNGR